MGTTRDYFAGRFAAQEARKTSSAAAIHDDWKVRQSQQASDIDALESSLDASDDQINAAAMGPALARRGGARPGPPAAAPTQRAKADAVMGRIDKPAPDGAASSSPLYALVLACRQAGLAEPVPEYQFHPLRRWRFDFAWPLHKVAVEIEGGIWTQGRHTRGAGVLADMQKYNAAAMLGWRLLRYSPQTLGCAIVDLRVILAGAK